MTVGVLRHLGFVIDSSFGFGHSYFYFISSKLPTTGNCPTSGLA